jgi:hypothetical protein
VKRTIELVLRDVGQGVVQRLAAGRGDARLLEQAGMDTAEEVLQCVDIDRRAVGLSIKRGTAAYNVPSLAREVVETAPAHVIEPVSVRLYGATSPRQKQEHLYELPRGIDKLPAAVDRRSRASAFNRAG